MRPDKKRICEHKRMSGLALVLRNLTVSVPAPASSTSPGKGWGFPSVQAAWKDVLSWELTARGGKAQVSVVQSVAITCPGCKSVRVFSLCLCLHCCNMRNNCSLASWLLWDFCGTRFGLGMMKRRLDWHISFSNLFSAAAFMSVTLVYEVFHFHV